MNYINICYLINADFLELTLTSIDYIKQFYKSTKYDLRFYIIGIDDFTVPDGIVYKKSKYSHTEMPIDHQRVYIPEIVNTDRCIFLDSDTIVTTCISRLWEIDLCNNAFGAVQSFHFPMISSMIQAYNLTTQHDDEFLSSLYCNIGVMLIDCKLWKTRNLSNRCLSAISSYKKHPNIKNIAEPGYNIALYKEWLSLDERWNYLPRDKYKLAYITHYYGQYFNQKPCHSMF